MRHYDMLELTLGQISSLDAAPVGTREKINAAYEERLAWSLEKPRGYICSPLSAPDASGILQNMMAARIYSDVASRNLDLIGKAPHAWLPEFLNDQNSAERQIGLDVGIGMLRSADCCIVCGNRISSGMKAEIELAGKENITVYTFSEINRMAVEEILAGTTKGIRKHTHIEPPITSDLRVLAMTPEEINGLRFTGKDIHQEPTVDRIESKRRDLFMEIGSDHLQTLDDYAAYRFQRDAGGDFIPAYERQMRSIEDKLLQITTSEGIPRGEARQLLADAIKPTKTPGQEITQAANQIQSQGKGRGR